MLQICYSNRLEVLLAPLIAQIDDAQRQNPLASIHVVTPNRAVEQYISLNIARQLTIAGNIKFYRLGGFIRDVVTRNQPENRPLDKTSIQMQIFSVLKDEAHLQGETFESLRRYFIACDSELEWTLRALQLSGEIARLFEEYTFSRPEMLREWLSSRPYHATRPTEEWQRALYRHIASQPLEQSPNPEGQLDLFASTTHSRTAWEHPMLFPRVFDLIEGATWPSELFIFGLSYVAPSFVRLFDQLSRLTHINLYTLNPCFEYWEDAHKKTLRQLKAEHYVFAQPPMNLSFDGEESPALNLWGRPGKEYLKTLNTLEDAVVTGGFIDPSEENQTLLTRIQSDILHRRSPRVGDIDPDESVTLIGCADRRSEIEAAATEILSALQEDSELRLQDIAVLICEDHKSEYLAHIEAVFWQKWRLPYNTIDRALEANSQVVTHIANLLSLGTEPLNLKTLEALVRSPLFWPPDADTIGAASRWLDQMRPSYMLKNHRSDTYFGENAHDLISSLEHFLAQALCAPVEAPAGLLGAEHEPYINLSELPIALDFYARLKALVETIDELQNAQLPLRIWAEKIDRYLSDNTYAIQSVDEFSLGQCRDTVRTLGETCYDDAHLPLKGFCALLIPKLEGLTGGMGQLLASGVIVSSLLPMRILPAKVMILVGLGAGGFPGKAQRNPLDLRIHERITGDVYPAERDRYLFLESLLSVRSRFLCTFVDVHPTNGETLAPSAIVEEFIFILEGYLGEQGVAQLLKRRSALPWNSEFTASSVDAVRPKLLKQIHRAVRSGATVDDDILRLSHPLHQARSTHWVSGTDQGHKQDEISVQVSHLKSFLKSPLQASARVRLGLFERAMPEPEQNLEPLASNGFDLAKIAADSFWDSADLDEAIATFERRLSMVQTKGRMPFGVFYEKEREKGLDWLEAWWRNADLVDLGCPTQYQTVRIGDGRRDETTDHWLSPLSITNPADASERRFILEGQLERVHRDGRTIARVVSSQNMTRKYFLDAFMTSVCLAAAGCPTSNPSRLIVLPTNPYAAERLTQFVRLPTQEQALAYLYEMSEELHSRFHNYRLSIEAVLKHFEQTEQQANASFNPLVVEKTSDQYGPIRDPMDFSAADQSVVDDYIQRRFWPWLKSEV